MNSVQPVGPNPTGAVPTQGVQAAPVSAPGTSATAVSAVSSSLSISMVHTQVDTMLQAIGGGVQDNQLLRMVIALMILQALLAKDGGSQQAAIDGLLDVLRTGAGQRTTAVSMHSATNVVQIQQQSTVLMTGQAALAPTHAEGDPNGPGGRMDLSA